MITFNDIYDASRKERYSENLEKLPENFINEVAEYLKDKMQMSSKSNEIFSDNVDKTKKQFENAKTLFKELLNRRRKKILNLILIASETGISKKDFENMLEVEKELFEELMKSIEISDKKVNSVLNGKSEISDSSEVNSEKEIKESVKTKIKFKENVDEFLDLDGKTIGPFDIDQIVELNESIANILVNSGKADKV